MHCLTACRALLITVGLVVWFKHVLTTVLGAAVQRTLRHTQTTALSSVYTS